MGLWAASAHYIQTPSLLVWKTILVEFVHWAGSLFELFSHIGRLDWNSSGHALTASSR